MTNDIWFYAVFIALFYVAVAAFIVNVGPAHATGTRVFNTSVRPIRLLTKQFASNANNFTLVDPTPDGTPLTLTSATGKSNMDGSATITLTNGFTAPVTLTAFVWQLDSVTPANSCWVRVAPVASGGANNYTQSVDSHYAQVSFSLAENTPFIIMSSAAVTGHVYTDAAKDANNNNSPAGY